MNLFFITSYGRTATYWLASVLNKHPDIFCAHGPTFKYFPLDEEHFERNTQIVSEREYYYGLTPAEILRHMEREVMGAKLYGNVHAFTANRLDKKLGSEARDLKRINLLRHPFTRIPSFAHHWVEKAQALDFARKNIEELIEGNSGCQSLMKLISERFEVDFSQLINRAFVYAIIQQGADVPDSRVECPHICCERLTKELDYFLWLFDHITGNALQPHENMIEAYKNSGRKNATTEHEKSAFEIAAQWRDWQRFIVRFWLDTNPQEVTLYEGLGYDLSMPE